jgi:5-oxoprolinase (ATP-hydrolysing)
MQSRISMCAMPAIPDHSLRISIDRGGTFTDVFASYPDPDRKAEEGVRRELVVKLLSVDAAYKDAPIEGIRRVLEKVGIKVEREELLPTDKIGEFSFVVDDMHQNARRRALIVEMWE